MLNPCISFEGAPCAYALSREKIRKKKPQKKEGFVLSSKTRHGLVSRRVVLVVGRTRKKEKR